MKEVYNNDGNLVQVPIDTPVKDIGGKKYLHTPEQQTEYDALQQETAAEKADYIANHKYKDDRRKAHGTPEEQLEFLAKNGINAFQARRVQINLNHKKGD